MQRNNSAPAAAATSSNAMLNIAEQAVMIQSSSSSDIMSIVSPTTRGQKLALANAKQESARREVELAKANQEVAEVDSKKPKHFHKQARPAEWPTCKVKAGTRLARDLSRALSWPCRHPWWR